MTNSRKTYTEEFKRDAVRLAKERGNIASVARDLEVDNNNLRKWIEAVDRDTDRAFPGKGT